MNEQLLAELERKLQNNEITLEQYLAQKAMLENQNLLVQDFSQAIEPQQVPSPQPTSLEMQYLNGNISYKDYQANLNNNMQGGFTPQELARQEAEPIINPGQTSTPQINTGMVSDLFNVEFPSRTQSAPLETGIQGQDNILYNDPQYSENQILPLRSVNIKNPNFNPNLNPGDLAPSGINPSEEAKKLSLIYPNATENIAKYTDTNSTEEAPLDFKQSFEKFLPFMNPYGSNIETELYSLGKFIGTEKGTQGRGLGIASSALSAGLGGARTLLSGLAQQKQTEKTAEEIRRKLALKNYTPQTQYLNQNSRGGI